MMQENKLEFFRQSGWLVIANTLCGVFLIGVHPIASQMPPAEYGLFTALLKLFTVLAIPAAGLQIVLAQQTAAALTPQHQDTLRATARGVVKALTLLWVVIAFGFASFQTELVSAFKVQNTAALWITLILVLGQLYLPVLQGLVQGMQNFLWLGISMIVNGFGRFAAILVAVLLLKGHAAGAMFGALIGLSGAALLAFIPARGQFRPTSQPWPWQQWLRRVIPLMLGTGSVLFLLNADMLAVQSHFPKEVTGFYAAPAMIGVGLVTFTTPMAAVMFPKLVRSFAQAQKSSALNWALAGTGILGALAALACTLWPELPLRIMYFRTPEYWQSRVLVPWFIWGMLPVTLANVLISNLLARERFRVVPWLALVAGTYGMTLVWVVRASVDLPHFAAFREVVKTLGLFSILLLLVAAAFTWVEKRAEGKGGRLVGT